MELKGKKINFLGDSITQGCGTSGEEHIFMNVLARSAGLAAARNYGISGTRIARQVSPDPDEQFDRDFCLRADEMDRDADAVVVFGGTNDFGHGDARIGKLSDHTEYSFCGAMNVLCEKLLSAYPAAAAVVFMTPTRRCSEYDEVNERGIRNCRDLAGYVELIKEICAGWSIPVLDLYCTLGVNPKIEAQRKLYMPDGLHPNDAGHVLIARRLESFLKTL